MEVISRTTGSISSKFGTKHPYAKRIQTITYSKGRKWFYAFICTLKEVWLILLETRSDNTKPISDYV